MYNAEIENEIEAILEIQKDGFGDQVKTIRYQAEKMFGWKHSERWFYYQLSGMDGRQAIAEWAIKWLLLLQEVNFKNFEPVWLRLERLITGNRPKLSLIEQMEVDFIRWKSLATI